jgi:NADPH:quinone reductase-like Zn-dependent oxidoreductase
MKAAVYRRHGSADVVTVDELPQPVPGDDEVLVRIHAATVGVVDSLARQGAPRYARVAFGLRRPKFAVLGSDFAGQVEAAGPAVTRFAVGDKVFGTTAPKFGAHAEYVCMPQNAAVETIPKGLSYAQAASVADATALCYLRDKARLGPGQAIAINGASGAVGSAAVQLARHFGATVTGVCGAAHAALVAELGADEVIDYATCDFTRGGRKYDVIFDAAGKSSFARCRAALNPAGIYLTTAVSPAILAQAAWTSRFKRAKKAMIAFTGLRAPDEKRADLRLITELCDASELAPVIESCYPLRMIADAYRRVDAGHKKGNVIVTMTGSDALDGAAV